MKRRFLKGRVFDIRRFCVHDGPGLRVTVFFKGCPLRCRWCHNPEGISFERRPVWFEARCIHCGNCAAIFEGGRLQAPPSSAAIDGCPTGALAWDSRDMTVEAVLDEVERDRVFFREGGGLTLSGGEPLAQPEAALALLEAARERGIGAAIETSLYAPAETVEAAACLCGTVFADCKAADPGLHEAATGVDNGLILDNLRRLLAGPHGGRVIVRTPLIPGWTATEANVAAIARLLAGLSPGTAWELLNYNPLAAGKYALAGQPGGLEPGARPLSPGDLARFRQLARDNGMTHVL